MHLRHDDRLSAFLDDELGERDALAVTRHLAACDSCRHELEELRRTRAALRDLPPVETPLSFMVESVVLGPRPQPRGPSPIALGAVVAASVVMVTAFVLGGSPGGTSPDVDRFVGDHVESVGGGPVVVPVMLDADGR